MIKQEKENLVAMLKPAFNGTHLYIVNCEGLTANQMYKLRHQFYQENIQCKQIPNALLRLLFSGTVYAALTELLQYSSLLIFAKDNVKKPAQIIQKFRKEEKTDKPLLKGAWANENIFIGEKSLAELRKLKSRDELIAEIVNLLQSPGQQIARVLASNQSKLCSAIKTIKNKQ